jgi:hypothetical protein|nr:MAG TPA: hypothetical protein [Bacteriophage sp.]
MKSLTSIATMIGIFYFGKMLVDIAPDQVKVYAGILVFFIGLGYCAKPS